MNYGKVLGGGQDARQVARFGEGATLSLILNKNRTTQIISKQKEKQVNYEKRFIILSVKSFSFC